MASNANYIFRAMPIISSFAVPNFFSARAFDSIDQLSGSFAAIKAKEAQQQGEVAETVKDLAKYAALAGVAYGAIRLWGK